MTGGAVHPAAITPPSHQLPFIEALYRALDNPMEAWPRAIYERLIYVPPRRDFRTIYVCDPDALRTVMLDRIEDFPKSAMQTRLLRPLLGDGVMTSEGARWKWQRQVASPAFQHSRIQSAAAPMARAAERAIERWRNGEAEVDLTSEMIRITFDIILDAMLSGRDDVDIEKMSDRIATYLMQIGRPTIGDVLGMPNWARNLMSPRSARAVRYLQGCIDAMIARRRAGERRDDLVNMLMQACDPETGRAMSDVDLRDNLMTFWAAGHETTAIVLTWALHLLSQDRQTEARVLQEIEQVAGDAPITAERAQHLMFTKQVVLEAMRLYPPVPLMTRTSLRATMLGGHEVRVGDIVVIPVYALHRHRLHWDEPDRFDPDRFEASRGLDKRRFVYMPFGAGKRICIGAAFATLEATIVLATLLRSVEVSTDAGKPVRPLFRITMRPEGGLRASIRPRTPQPQPPSLGVRDAA